MEMDMDMDNFTCHSGSFNTSSCLDCDGSYGDEVVFFCCGLSTSLLPDSSLSYSLSPSICGLTSDLQKRIMNVAKCLSLTHMSTNLKCRW